MSIFILECTAVEMIYQHLNPKKNIIKKTKWMMILFVRLQKVNEIMWCGKQRTFLWWSLCQKLSTIDHPLLKFNPQINLLNGLKKMVLQFVNETDDKHWSQSELTSQLEMKTNEDIVCDTRRPSAIIKGLKLHLRTENSWSVLDTIEFAPVTRGSKKTMQIVKI